MPRLTEIVRLDAYYVTTYEMNYYDSGYAVMSRSQWLGNFVALFPGQSRISRERAQALADKMNLLALQDMVGAGHESQRDLPS